MGTEQDCCERACRGEVHLAQCDWKQHRRAKDRYDSVYGYQVLQASKVKDDEHMKIMGRLGSLIGRVWMDEKLVKCVNGPSVRVRSEDAAVQIERSIALMGWRGGQLGGSSSPASVESMEWRGKRKRRDDSSGREQSGDASGRGECREPHSENTAAEVSGSSHPISPEERDGRENSSSRDSAMAVVEYRSRFT